MPELFAILSTNDKGSHLLMRSIHTLFMLACVLAGLFAGLWWTGVSPSALGLKNTAAPTETTPGITTTAAPSEDASVSANALPVNSTSPTAVLSAFSFHDGIMRVAPSVVSIYASDSTNPVESGRSSQGSGVIVDANGIVLTNLHLIENFRSITAVLSDGRSFAATLIGSDSETDLAVVRINASMLPVTKLNEAAPLKVGDVVLAIGNPFGVGQTVTQGIVSATRRRIANGSVWQNFIQIDAAINPGNSGGALINPLGQLVGVNTAVFRGDSNAIGIGYAIPADLLSQVVPQIIEHGSVSRGWLGLGVDDLNMFPTLKSVIEHGAVITAVQDGGPADQVGVRPMDVVVQLGEQPISSATQLLLAVSALPPGATVKLVLQRSPDAQPRDAGDGIQPIEQLTYKVRLGTRPIIERAQPQ